MGRPYTKLLNTNDENVKAIKTISQSCATQKLRGLNTTDMKEKIKVFLMVFMIFMIIVVPASLTYASCTIGVILFAFLSYSVMGAIMCIIFDDGDF